MEPKTITKPGKLTKRFLAPCNNWIKISSIENETWQVLTLTRVSFIMLPLSSVLCDWIIRISKSVTAAGGTRNLFTEKKAFQQESFDLV